jgi:hypothetical protein
LGGVFFEPQRHRGHRGKKIKGQFDRENLVVDGMIDNLIGEHPDFVGAKHSGR